MARVRALSGRSARLKHSQFLVEGPQGVREAALHAPDQVRDIYLTETAAERYPEIVDAARAADLWLHLGTDEVLAAMSPNCQGVLAVLNVSCAKSQDLTPKLVAILSNVRDPGNAGTVIRAADAAGADLVILAGDTVDLYAPKTVRSTAGSLFHLPVLEIDTLEEAVALVREAGLAVLAADGAGDLDLDDVLDGQGPDLAKPTAWVFGNEAWGLTDDERASADAVVRVPLRGLAESLNLATAASVCLYYSSRAQR